MAPIAMTLSDLQGRASNAGLLKCYLLYSCAAISTADIPSRGPFAILSRGAPCITILTGSPSVCHRVATNVENMEYLGISLNMKTH